MASILIVRPVLNDFCTQEQRIFEVLVHAHAVLLKSHLPKRGFSAADLHAEGACREEVEKIIEINGDLCGVLFTGHGNERGDKALGQGGEACFDLENVQLLGERRIPAYFVCCHAAKALAPAAVESGSPFSFSFDSKVWLSPRTPEWAIGQCVMSASYSLLRGLTPQAAYDKAIRTYNRFIDRITTKYSHDLAWLYSTVLLEDNRDAFKLHAESHQSGREVNIVQYQDPPNEKEGLTEEEIDIGIHIIEDWVKDPKTRPTDYLGVTGSGHAVRPVDILNELKRRKESNEFGQNDQLERFLRRVVKSRR